MMPLVLLSGLALAAAPGKMPPDLERGEELYRATCWHCHGERGLGDGPIADKLKTPPPALAGRYPAAKHDEAVALVQGGRGDMPGFSQSIDKHDTLRILRWLNSLDAETGRPRAGMAEEDEPADEEDAPSAEDGPGAASAKPLGAEGAEENEP